MKLTKFILSKNGESSEHKLVATGTGSAYYAAKMSKSRITYFSNVQGGKK